MGGHRGCSHIPRVPPPCGQQSSVLIAPLLLAGVRIFVPRISPEMPKGTVPFFAAVLRMDWTSHPWWFLGVLLYLLPCVPSTKSLSFPPAAEARASAWVAPPLLPRQAGGSRSVSWGLTAHDNADRKAGKQARKKLLPDYLVVGRLDSGERR